MDFYVFMILMKTAQKKQVENLINKQKKRKEKNTKSQEIFNQIYVRKIHMICARKKEKEVEIDVKCITQARKKKDEK